MEFGNTFVEVAIILAMATTLGFIGQWLRQPLLIMFLATGILAGSSFFGVITSYEEIELLANIGVAVLLFIVGLKLDLNLIRTIGPVALATGLGQILFTSVIGFVIALALGMSVISAAYVAVALTFSSTIIIVKLLSDKREVDSLHGQIAIGFLIVQDIAAILALVALTTFGSTASAEDILIGETLLLLVKGVGLLVGVALLMRYVLPGLTQRMAGSSEMLVLFAIAWAVFLGAASEWLGYTKEVGAFLGGISLASTVYRDAIGSRLTTLRDFLLLFFFIDLGARLDWSTVGAQLGDALIFSLFVLIGNPLIVLIIMGIMGYRRRTSFLAGLTVAQISEFSLIVASLGLSLGHISQETMGLITLVGVATIFLSTYMILYSGQLYNLLAKPLKIFERRNPYREAAIDTPSFKMPEVDVILIGLGNYGSALAEQLLRRRKTLVGVDFAPDALQKWRARGVQVLYGDIEDPELLGHLPLNQARWVVNSVRSRDLNMALIHHLRDARFDGGVAVTALNQEEADLFKAAGADIVFRPFVDAAEQAADALTHAMEFLPDHVNWPITFREVRIRSESAVVGQTLRNLPLRTEIGVSVLAVSRAGRVYYDPGPDFQIFPGDRVVLMGPEEALEDAELILNEPEPHVEEEFTNHFVLAEVRVGETSPLSGHTLAELHFRQKHGVTVVGVRRNGEDITTITPSQQIMANDCLIVVGFADRVKELKMQEPL